ncbi:MAG: helix-turn-helix domain-containing protein [Marvinbryantia sp.]|jgi:transcriptional regulator with XRE-family HTH domain
MDTIKIGLRIKRQRQLLNYTREELAEKVNITPRFCYDLELGNKKMSVDTLHNMCDALHLSADYLLFGESDCHGFDSILSLIDTCPGEHLNQLETIVSTFIAAVKES